MARRILKYTIPSLLLSRARCGIVFSLGQCCEGTMKRIKGSTFSLASTVPTDVDKIGVIDTNPRMGGSTLERRSMASPRQVGKLDDLNQNPSKAIRTHLDAIVTQSGIRHMFDFSSVIPLRPKPREAKISAESQSWLLGNNIPCRQQQLPALERYAKLAYEESFPWMVSILLWGSAAVLSHIPEMFQFGFDLEFGFLMYQMHKVITKFNPAVVPQPMLETRQWTTLRDLAWSSHGTLSSKRDFLMGWFYKAPFEKMRQEDAMEFLSWMKYGMTLDAISKKERKTLSDDLKKLEEEVNEGMPLPNRASTEKELSMIRFNLEPLRFRFKPLPFYGVTHGIRALLSAALPKQFGFTYHTPKDSTKELGYWFRPALTTSKESSISHENNTENIVFVHGVGGMGFYYEMLKDLCQTTDGNIVLLDLPFVSLQISDDIPSVQNQISSIESIMNECFAGPQSKATFVGHSFGSIVLSWMVQQRPERVANCVFVDPICFHQHLCKSLFNFHFARTDRDTQRNKEWSSPFSIEGLMNLAGTEMHTNNAMLRQFSWNANALWPEDLEERGISSHILLSGEDAIVPSAEVHELIASFNERRKGKKKDNAREQNSNLDEQWEGENNMIRIQSDVIEGIAHGEMLFNGHHRHTLLTSISDMIQQEKEKSSRS